VPYVEHVSPDVTAFAFAFQPRAVFAVWQEGLTLSEAMWELRMGGAPDKADPFSARYGVAGDACRGASAGSRSVLIGAGKSRQ
jgi:hypothetical protein